MLGLSFYRLPHGGEGKDSWYWNEFNICKLWGFLVESGNRDVRTVNGVLFIEYNLLQINTNKSVEILI